MPKNQKHGNREAKKPKQVKAIAPVETAGLLARAGGAPAKKKG